MQLARLSQQDQEEGHPGFLRRHYLAQEGELLAHLPAQTVKDAWFTMAHLILDPGSRILDVGCGGGAFTYAMAVFFPDHHFIGIDRDRRKIQQAKKEFARPNLEFMAGDIIENFLPPKSLDCVINSYALHDVYSRTNGNERAVHAQLERHFALLKQGGLIFIRDYAKPEGDDFVILEMADERSFGADAASLSDPDLLLQFSEQARAPEGTALGGFYIEDLPPRFPRTRRFRLPHKWAYEFVLRKDNRETWDQELRSEYTFYTEREYRKSLRSLGARVLYTAPHWDEQQIKKRFTKKFRMYDEGGIPLGPPPTSFIALAQKTGERTSLEISERRPVRREGGSIRITAMRDDVEGKIIDVVSRGRDVTEVIPYYITASGVLRIFVHEGVPRSLVNTVPRMASALDGKKWSGHMTEAIALPGEALHAVKPGDRKSLVLFARDYLGLKPADDAQMEDGPALYPAPDFIDERIETKYMRVETEKNDFPPRHIPEDIAGFSTQGRIRDVEAQSILNAAAVGLLPTCRLEVQVLALFERLRLPYTAWSESPLVIDQADPPKGTKLQEMIHKLAEHDDRYQEIKGKAGQIKTHTSIFVEEAQVDGGLAGLSSRDVDFVAPQDDMQNIAVVLPVTRKNSGEVMAGIVETYLPVPQRYKGTGYMLSCPSYPLPRDITNFEMARKYIAEKFDVKVECVARMGEGYFTHIGMTAQRIYPFAVSTAGASGWRKAGRTHGPCQYTPLYHLNKLLYLDNYYSFLKVASEAITCAVGYNHSLSGKTSMEQIYTAQKSVSVSVRTSELPHDSLPARSKDIS